MVNSPGAASAGMAALATRRAATAGTAAKRTMRDRIAVECDSSNLLDKRFARRRIMGQPRAHRKYLRTAGARYWYLMQSAADIKRGSDAIVSPRRAHLGSPIAQLLTREFIGRDELEAEIAIAVDDNDLIQSRGAVDVPIR